MLLSRLLLSLKQYDNQYRIINEREFETLALTAAEVGLKACTFLDDEKYLKEIKENISMILTTEGLYNHISTCFGDTKGFCVTGNPRKMYFLLHNQLSGHEAYIREPFPTKVGQDCRISPLACIAPNNVVLGNHVTVEEFVVIRENTEIGNNSMIRSGVKLGGQGFEYKRDRNGMLEVKHLGGIKIGEHVEIQYNSCIDRAVYPWDNTEIGDNTKIDNLVHVGHGVKINHNVLIAAQSGIGGRTVIEENAWIGFSATISNGLKLGKNTRANIGAVVTKDVETGQAVSGNFAIDHDQFIANLKASVIYRGGV